MADHNERFEQSLTIARRVLPFMGSNGIPATPDNYMIFYHYHQDQSSLVKKAVDSLLQSGLQWNEQTTKRLFEQLFGSEVNLNLLQMNEKLAAEIMVMTQDIIEDSQATTKQADLSARRLEGSLEERDEFKRVDEVTDWLKSTFAEIDSIKTLYDDLSGRLKTRTTRLDGIVESLNNLEKVALTDELTQLANRRAWNQHLEIEFARFKRYKADCSMILLDIDDFKCINDGYGHLVGDKALREVARVIDSSIREIDFAARFGGEEFTVLMPGTDLQGAADAAERLRLSLMKTAFTVKGELVPITASCGAAQFRDQDRDSQDPLNRADKALYLAKKQGKNRTCLESQV